MTEKQHLTEPFLQQVATWLYRTYGNRLDLLTVVLPDRRAGVFFNEYLNRLIDRPILGPDIVAVDDLMSRLSDLQPSDTVNLTLLLHRIYTEVTGHPESLDEFYFWGEILLADFDIVDKYLVDARQLFRNIYDLKEIEERFDFLTDTQKAAIRQFWGGLVEIRDGNRRNFLEIWGKLADVYERFRQRLTADGIGYSGLIYRNVAEKIDNGAFTWTNPYAFVGFNGLTPCEKRLFTALKKAGQANFFWDCDTELLQAKEQEAGLFLRENVITFPSPSDFELQSTVQTPDIRLISVPGQVAQVQALNQDSIFTPSPPLNFDSVAIVLADESLMLPTTAALTYRVPTMNINITMGYPLRDTPVFSFITRIMELYRKGNCREMAGQTVFNYRAVLALLNHQLLTGTEIAEIADNILKEKKLQVPASDFKNIPLLEIIFQKRDTWHSALDAILQVINILAAKLCDGDGSLEAEYFYQAYITLSRLRELLRNHKLADSGAMTLDLFYRLLLRSMQSVRIPLEGEPLSDLQVMGLLETRALDFQQVIILSANEGTLPRNKSEHSFITYNLRKAFGLPAFEEDDAVQAYYFYRLLRRAQHVRLIYDSSGEGPNSGEMSRFLTQLLYNSAPMTFSDATAPKKLDLFFHAPAVKTNPVEIRRTKEHSAKLIAMKCLTPSALNTWLDCQKKFYFRYIAEIREPDEITEEIDSRLFGSLFHKAAEIVYTALGGNGQLITAHALEDMRSSDLPDKATMQAFAEEMFHSDHVNPEFLSGENLLIKENIKTYLLKMLENDRRYAPFRLAVSTEKNDDGTPLHTGLEDNGYRARFNTDNGSVTVGGIFDRVDIVGEQLRIIDYKTGRNVNLDYKTGRKAPDHAADIRKLTDPDEKERRKEIFQTLVYAEVLSRTLGRRPPITPCIYKIDDFFADFNPEIRYNRQPVDYQEIADEFQLVLTALLNEVLACDGIYAPTKIEKHCNTCYCAAICGNRNTTESE
ncbi:MAG: PD-(D/E)XK nuclease family protein [Bacteroidales bacterium]|jgi:hypothetical protein|nr:PD-(D/E)XK nuclease family protein [Bacteroidales bacterium]